MSAIFFEPMFVLESKREEKSNLEVKGPLAKFISSKWRHLPFDVFDHLCILRNRNNQNL